MQSLGRAEDGHRCPLSTGGAGMAQARLADVSPRPHTLQAGAMHSSRYLVDQLRFPAPPARIDRTWREAPFSPPVATEYLAEIRRWRARLLEVLAGDGLVIDGAPELTQRARDHLILLLSSEWDAGTAQWARDSSYNLEPFPSVPSVGHLDDPMSFVMEVLRWRAAV